MSASCDATEESCLAELPIRDVEVTLLDSCNAVATMCGDQACDSALVQYRLLAHEIVSKMTTCYEEALCDEAVCDEADDLITCVGSAIYNGI